MENFAGAPALTVGDSSPALEIVQAPAKPRRSTREERLQRLIDTKAEIFSTPPTVERGLVMFGYRTLAVATLPYNEPKPEKLINGAWVRRSGQWSVYVQGGPLGIPFGTSPRLFLYWLVTEVIRTGSPKINLGSFRQFCRTLDIDPSMGKRGQGRAMLQQVHRVLATRWCISRDSELGNGRTRSQKEYIQFVDSSDIYWTRNLHDDQLDLFESSITLSHQMFEELKQNPVPLDIRAVRELKSRPMALDTYTWLGMRNFALRESILIPWTALQLQFGTEYKQLRDFRRAFVESLDRAKECYPGLKVRVIDKEGLILYPSPTPVLGRPLAARAAIEGVKS